MLPCEDRFCVRPPAPRQAHRGLSGAVHAVRGYWARRPAVLARVAAAADRIEKSATELGGTDDDALKNRLRPLCHGAPATEIVPGPASEEMLALACEVSRRTIGQTPYREQIMAALIIRRGAVAEMATGEGKSLASALGAILLASAGKPVHVLTANDYLARRDAEIMAPLFAGCGLDVSFVIGETPAESRRQRYDRTVVYTTAKELLGDYLRDRLKIGQQVGDLQRAVKRTLLGGARATARLALRGLHAVVVDEADSILIDEAVTPLILSSTQANFSLESATLAAASQANALENGRHYLVSWHERSIFWTRQGETVLEAVAARLPRAWSGRLRCRELMTLAIQARELFRRDEHYLVKDDQIVLLDRMTGRMTPSRHLQIGLQQAVEAKEGVAISKPTATLAKMSYQKFFRLFPHLGGTSGTVREAAGELWRVYHLPVLSVPTHRPVIRRPLPWRCCHSDADKIQAITEAVEALRSDGQPVLVGTRTVESSERLADRFQAAGISCRVLNAVRHREEARIVARAGEKGAVTIATNMAGRGTDIRLGEGVAAIGGLQVICAEPQDSGRLDRQLFGRCGRQGDPGFFQIFTSRDDFLFCRFRNLTLRRMTDGCFALGVRGRTGLLRVLVRFLQSRCEQRAAAQRMAILVNDDWLEKYLAFPTTDRAGTGELIPGG